jgi:hypothetical protein
MSWLAMLGATAVGAGLQAEKGKGSTEAVTEAFQEAVKGEGKTAEAAAPTPQAAPATAAPQKMGINDLATLGMLGGQMVSGQGMARLAAMREQQPQFQPSAPDFQGMNFGMGPVPNQSLGIKDQDLAMEEELRRLQAARRIV